ncbi:MAG: hypothetical protein GY820_31365 [Gammaproteobacteria bacterium]|nr:hypothetical protein [Gammaproteobacteria bacterium]
MAEGNKKSAILSIQAPSGGSLSKEKETSSPSPTEPMQGPSRVVPDLYDKFDGVSDEDFEEDEAIQEKFGVDILETAKVELEKVSEVAKIFDNCALPQGKWLDIKACVPEIKFEGYYYHDGLERWGKNFLNGFKKKFLFFKLQHGAKQYPIFYQVLCIYGTKVRIYC